MSGRRLHRKNAIYTPASGTTIMINYSFNSQILEVEYTGGRVYHYYRVDAGVWEEYKSAIQTGNSSGTFVNRRIKPFYKGDEII